MSEPSFQIESRLVPANGSRSKVRTPFVSAARPSLVTLESGIQALVQVTGFTYVQEIPGAICGFGEEQINPTDFLVIGPDGMNVELKR